MKVITQGAQFGRIVQVELRNYITKQKFFIDNNLRIDFTFFKTIDETSEASVGQVKIYGLTQETFNEMYSVAGELELRFGYQGTEVQTLFVATITSMYPEHSQEGLCAIFNVSANFAEYTYTTGSIQGANDRSIMTALFDIQRAFKDHIDHIAFRMTGIPPEYDQLVTEYVQTKKINFSHTGHMGEVLSTFARKFMLDIYRDESLALNVCFAPAAIPYIIEEAQKPYPKVQREAQHEDTSSVTFLKELEQEQSDVDAIILNQYTGLLGYPKQEYKLISVPADWKPAASEDVTRKGQETIMTNAQKKKEADEKYAKKVAKATEKGTLDKLKPQKQTRQGNIQVKRKYLRVNALLNPSVKPQTQVNVQSNLDVYSGIYRVRTATYQGTNGNGNCNMELYCEDTTRKSDTVATDQDKRELGDLSVEGGVGDQIDGEGVESGVTE